MTCPNCQKTISKNAQSCPNCGEIDFWERWYLDHFGRKTQDKSQSPVEIDRSTCGVCQGNRRTDHIRVEEFLWIFSRLKEEKIKCTHCNGSGFTESKRIRSYHKQLSTGRIMEIVEPA